MSTQFFERQETQKTYTRWLVWAFIAAILVVVALINLVVLVGIGGNPMVVISQAPEVIGWTTLVVLGVIFGACWHKSSEMRSGGAAVARSLGGVAVTADDGDLKRKRLLNIVEEMAIAARIRKPQVFVLPDEPGINAFAAGHSVDEAAVAVTQGALEKFDRDQLQAVIGHEFSHILNGDMKLNMRLATWIFGLFVITDLASRVMRRSRGKDSARIRVIAFGIFAAGSVGMLAGRLLQAAVSRRREHLADASSVQFTRNPQALQSAFVIMAASAEGTRLENTSSADMAHMFFAGSEPSWAAKLGGSWFATHPPLEERVRAIDSKVTTNRFKSLVSEERRKLNAKAKAEAGAGNAVHEAGSSAALSVNAEAAGVSAAAPASAAASTSASMPAIDIQGLSIAATFQTKALTETLPTGVRLVAGRALPPDVLRNRLTADQQASVTKFISQVELNLVAVQATFIAAMLATEAAKWRTQLTKLAPVLGAELFKEVPQQVTNFGALAPQARMALLTDLLTLLDDMEPADRKRLRGVARAFAPTVTAGDMFRFALTRLVEKKLAKVRELPPPVPLPERAPQICELYATLAHYRLGVGKQGQNSYRAGLMGMLPAPTWLPFPEKHLSLAQLDAALAGVAQIHPTGKRAFSEGMARVIAVGGRLTVPQVDLLRGICIVVDCQVPVIPADVTFEDPDAVPARQAQASAR